MADITSRPYQPNAEVCCEACVFGRGEHSEWCLAGRADVETLGEALGDAAGE